MCIYCFFHESFRLQKESFIELIIKSFFLQFLYCRPIDECSFSNNQRMYLGYMLIYAGGRVELMVFRYQVCIPVVVRLCCI